MMDLSFCFGMDFCELEFLRSGVEWFKKNDKHKFKIYN